MMIALSLPVAPTSTVVQARDPAPLASTPQLQASKNPAVRTELTQAVRQTDTIARFAQPDLLLLTLAPGLRANSVGPPPAFDVSYLQDLRESLQRMQQPEPKLADDATAADNPDMPLQARNAAQPGQDPATGGTGAGESGESWARNRGTTDEAAPRDDPSTLTAARIRTRQLTLNKLL